MRVLAIVAHPDDEVIGPGGTLARHACDGDEVHVLTLAEGQSARAGHRRSGDEVQLSRSESEAAGHALGVAKARRLDLDDNRLDTYPLLDLARQVSEVVAEVRPEVVYTHHHGDLNADHELTARAAMIACRPHVSSVRWLLGFATLSATDAGYAGREAFVPNVWADVTGTLDRKLAAMSCYASELRDFPHPRSLEAIRAQAVLSGAHAGVAAAEAFSVLRGTWPPSKGSDHQ